MSHRLKDGVTPMAVKLRGEQLGAEEGNHFGIR